MAIMAYIWNKFLRRLFKQLPTASQLLEKLFLFVILQAMLVSVLCMPHLEVTEQTIPTGFFTSVKRKYCNIEIYIDQHVWMKSIGYTLLALSECKGRLHLLSLCVYGIVFGRNWWTNVCSTFDFFVRHDYGANIINARPLGIILFTYFVLQVIFTVTLFVQNLFLAVLGCNEFLEARLTREHRALLDNTVLERGDALRWHDNGPEDALNVERLLDAIVLGSDDHDEDATNVMQDDRLIYADEDEYFIVVGGGAGADAYPILNFFNIDLHNNQSNNTMRELGAGDCS